MAALQVQQAPAVRTQAALPGMVDLTATCSCTSLELPAVHVDSCP